MPTASRAPATLLFCHGGGFCKDVWTPIIARLEQSALFQRTVPRPRIVTFNFPYHGENRDVSQHATVHLENPSSPRVSHPAMKWAEWATAEVQRRSRLLREAQGSERGPLIGIGHSMGAAALWGAEAANPGTFDGLILFEPMVNVEENPNRLATVDFLVSTTLKRKGNWYGLVD
jgi:pimeloyl-ACP methyl ester carboxylesterase